MADAGGGAVADGTVADDTEADDTGAAAAPPRGRRAIAAIIVLVLLTCGGFLLGRVTSPTVAATPTTDSATAGFLRDMQVHHAQAVDMAMTVRDHVTEADFADLRLLAYDIAIGQSNQSGQMYALLESWGLPQASRGPAMKWMSQPVIDGSSPEHAMEGMGAPGTVVAMPGLASAADLAELRTLDGAAEAKLFLTLMIAHHQGGVAMAQAVLARSDQPDLVTLATGIIASQKADIVAMQGMLAKLG